MHLLSERTVGKAFFSPHQILLSVANNRIFPLIIQPLSSLGAMAVLTNAAGSLLNIDNMDVNGQYGVLYKLMETVVYWLRHYSLADIIVIRVAVRKTYPSTIRSAIHCLTCLGF